MIDKFTNVALITRLQNRSDLQFSKIDVHMAM